MAADDMGKVSKKLRLAFAVSSVVVLGVLAVSPIKDQLQEWKRYKREYARLAETRPDTKRLMADFHPGIDQIWLPNFNVTDRCITCHQGMTQSSLLDPSVPIPFRAHSPIPHRVKDWGCVVCHRGQGLATEAKEAHEATLAWEQPALPVRYLQGSCGVCHTRNMPETPRLNQGREMMVRLNCIGCHRLKGIERPAMLGPDLTNLGTKTSRQWIYKWLKEPRTITDSTGNITVNGYENQEEPRMPHFRLSEQELLALSAYLSSCKNKPVEPYKFNAQVVAALEKKADLKEQGELRFRQMFCTTCHAIAVTRAGETKLIGGNIGPELTKVGSKIDANWLVAWLRDPQAYLPHSLMPRYGWSDEDLYKVSQYIMTSLTDPDLLSNVPKMATPGAVEVQLGRRLFQEKGCSGCHVIAGIKTQEDFGPDLSGEGIKTVSQLEFGNSKIPRRLSDFIETKISDPFSVNAAARMPQYNFSADDLQALTTALFSMAGPQSTPGFSSLVLPAPKPAFQPAGEFGKVYERYKCYVCHRFNGYGGTLAPDLSYEGSRAQRRWMIDFLKNPQTLRPTLTFRMPQLNMTAEEASVAADYIGMVLQNPGVDLADTQSKPFTSEQAALGKQLYEVKYQCHSCHTIGASGGYVGPNLSNTGNWLTAAWVSAWLKNPQALVPGALEPRRNFTEQEVQDLTAYLLTLKQTTLTKGAAASGGQQ